MTATSQSTMFSESDRTRIRGLLGEAKSRAIEALSASDGHSVRLTKQIEKICAALEYAQATAARLRVSP